MLNMGRMNKLKKRRVFGFTLVEMLVAASIAALLAAAGMVSFVNANKKARDGRRKSDMEQVRTALELYRTDMGSYPTASPDSDLTARNFNNMVGSLDDYLTVTTPMKDPKNPDAFGYKYVTAPVGFDTCSSNKSYELCAFLEADPDPAPYTAYCLCNP